VFKTELPVGHSVLGVLGEFILEPVDDTTTRVVLRASQPIGSKLKVMRLRSQARKELEEFASTVFTNLLAMAGIPAGTG